MQMSFANAGVSDAGLTIDPSCPSYVPGLICAASTCPSPGPWQFSQPIANSENGGLAKCPLPSDKVLGRPLWQEMHPGSIGRLNPALLSSYPGDSSQRCALE